ncbi:MAG: NAD(P)-dependent glycerol-3-phosphate dehydrogenase [Deltaproteobacteria bacterium]|nr:NAD(P)-dependent glycerol-3-phosphate dehydrogenase [Deltaproteobacteria bacterium]
MGNVAVIGSGSWGTALANAFADRGNSVTLWGRTEQILEVNALHENRKYLPGFKLSEKICATLDIEQSVKSAEVIVCAIPTQQIRKVFQPLSSLLKGKLIVNSAKGIEEKSHVTVSRIFEEIAPANTYLVLSGPSFAQEVVQRLPTAVTVASKATDAASTVQRMVSNSYLRAYTGTDVIGVELGGALKNVIAIASGVASGLKLGHNAQAAIINRGVAEIIRMGKCKGANPMTFLGLSGMGDLILTCTGPLSRNRRLGQGIGEGKKLDQIQRELGGVAEGVYTARSAYELSRQLNIEMPITEQVYRVLFEATSVQSALTELMGRGLKEEWDIG